MSPTAYPKSKQVRKKAPQRLKRVAMKKRPSKVVRDRSRMAFCASLPCIACLVTGRKQVSRTHADHIKTRGAGGKEIGNLWPLCAFHHDERHRVGLQTFEAMHNLDAVKAGTDVEYLFQASAA